ncbi:GAF domain-containing protein [Chloroflexota bacterium]
MMEKIEHQYYQSICEFAEGVNSAHSPKDVLSRIVEGIAKAMGAKACSVFLLVLDNKILLRLASYGLSEEYLKKGVVSAEKSVGEALAGKAVTFLNVPDDERIQYREEAKQEGIASILAVPMMYKMDAIGIILVYTGETHHFTDTDIYFVNAAAHLGAIALQNAKDMRFFGFT